MPYFYTPELKKQYEDLLKKMVVRPTWVNAINSAAKQIIKGKDTYIEVSKHVGNMPWELIGLIHKLESDCDFTKHLHNGDSLQRRTHQVPAGRPLGGEPPFTFLESAIDAIEMKGYHKVTDWNDPYICYCLEKYNGFGYELRGIESPYLWSGTNNYTKGKYIKDGPKGWRPNVVSEQVGCIPILMRIRELTKTQEVVEKKAESRRITFTERVTGFTKWAGLGSLITMSSLTDVKNFVTDNASIIILIVGVSAWLAFKYINYMSERELAEGRYTPNGSVPKQDDNANDVAPATDNSTPTTGEHDA